MALQRKQTRIGLDIGASGVRAVQLTRQAQTGGPDSYMVANAACGDRSRIAGDVQGEQGGSQENDRSLLSRQIGDCLGRASFRGKTVAAALSPPDVEFHTLELPPAIFHANEAEAAQIVRFEVERLMTQQPAAPQPVSRGAIGQTTNVETRHWRLPPTNVPGPNAIGAGAAHETINRTIEVCAEAGLTCSDLDTTATALTRFGAALQCRTKDQIWGVLDVGDRQARLVLCLDDTPILVRTAGAGGRAWTQRIADALQVSFKAAEIHKRDYGIALTGRQNRIPADEGTRSELASLILGAVRADLNDLASEVKRSYEYVLSCYPGRQAADLVLCGGGSLLHYFPEFLGNALGIPVRRASTYLQITTLGSGSPVDEALVAPRHKGRGADCRLSFAAEGVGRRDRQTSRPRVRRADRGGRVREGPGGSVHAPLEILAVAVGLAISE